MTAGHRRNASLPGSFHTRNQADISQPCSKLSEQRSQLVKRPHIFGRWNRVEWPELLRMASLCKLGQTMGAGVNFENV